MSRSLLGIFAGAAIAFTVGIAVGTVNMWIYPVVPGFDPSSRADLARMATTMPFGALLLLMLGWVLAAVAGARVALQVESGGARWPGAVVGGLVFAGVARKPGSSPTRPGLRSPPWLPFSSRHSLQRDPARGRRLTSMAMIIMLVLALLAITASSPSMR